MEMTSKTKRTPKIEGEYKKTLPNQTYQDKPNKPNLPNQTYYTKNNRIKVHKLHGQIRTDFKSIKGSKDLIKAGQVSVCPELGTAQSQLVCDPCWYLVLIFHLVYNCVQPYFVQIIPHYDMIHHCSKKFSVVFDEVSFSLLSTLSRRIGVT